MIAKVNGNPTEEELKERISRQLGWRGTDTVSLIWYGYLAGLLEWGLIDISVYDKLLKELPEVGNKEIYELFADEKISPERERELDEFVKQRPLSI